MPGTGRDVGREGRGRPMKRLEATMNEPTRTDLHCSPYTSRFCLEVKIVCTVPHDDRDDVEKHLRDIYSKAEAAIARILICKGEG